MHYGNSPPNPNNTATFISGPGYPYPLHPATPSSTKVNVLHLSQTMGQYLVLYKNPLNLSPEQAHAYLAEAESQGNWVKTKANSQKWFCNSPCKCPYPFGCVSHPPHDMPLQMKELLQESIRACTTTPPSNHIMKNQTEECQQFNAETAYITPDFNCANLNFYNFDSWTPQHSDDEQIFQTQDVSPAGELSIISISIGAPKKMQ